MLLKLDKGHTHDLVLYWNEPQSFNDFGELETDTSKNCVSMLRSIVSTCNENAHDVLLWELLPSVHQKLMRTCTTYLSMHTTARPFTHAELDCSEDKKTSLSRLQHQIFNAIKQRQRPDEIPSHHKLLKKTDVHEDWSRPIRGFRRCQQLGIFRHHLLQGRMAASSSARFVIYVPQNTLGASLPTWLTIFPIPPA